MRTDSVIMQLMHPSRLFIATAAALLLHAPLFAQPAPAPESAFTPLFNGRDLTGWYGLPEVDPNKLSAEERARLRREHDEAFRRHWRAENGELVNDGQGPYATTERDYGDIELRLEYRTVPKADSGIYLRGTPQVQIWDTTQEGGKWHLGADKGSGGLWNNSPGAPGKDPLVKADRPFGEWNSIRIVQIGERTWVWLNDQLTVDGARMENFWDRSKPLPRTGPIQLQTHGGEIRWRNIRIREIGAEEAVTGLATRDEAFTSIFNGRDWAGWNGPVQNSQIVDGAIVCKPDAGGTIYTEKVYRDFVVRLEFKLPEAGNNGLAIRYPGK